MERKEPQQVAKKTADGRPVAKRLLAQLVPSAHHQVARHTLIESIKSRMMTHPHFCVTCDIIEPTAWRFARWDLQHLAMHWRLLAVVFCG
jgi:hypothetical protein